jgi:hypothetical protein
MLLGFEQMKLSGFEPNPDLKWERIGDVPAPDDGIEGDICRVDGFCYSRCYRQQTSHPTH